MYKNEIFSHLLQAQFDSLQVPVESSPFYRQFKKAPHRLQISAYTEKMIEIQNEAKSVISERVLPAFKRLGDFIQTEYLPNLRSNPGEYLELTTFILLSERWMIKMFFSFSGLFSLKGNKIKS